MSQARRLLPAVLFLVVLSVGAEDYRLVVVADELRWPWSVTQLPDDSFLITEREGRLLHLQTDGSRSVVEGTPATLFAGQGGYFDVLLHPDFSTNRLIYLSYAVGSETSNATAIFRGVLEEGRIRGGQQILRVAQNKDTPQHYGGRMVFVGENELLLTTGDGFEQREQAQSMRSELGKVLRIDENGNATGLKDSVTGKLIRIWTRGHRNPQGIVVVPDSNQILIHEHGPKGGDELNQLEPAGNYGWPAVSQGVDYSGAYVTPFRRAQNMLDPLWVWTPSIAPSGMAWYDGSRFPGWRSSLLIGALVDREVRRLELFEGAVVKEESLFSELDQRIRDVRVFGEEIYLLTDGEQAQLIHVKDR